VVDLVRERGAEPVLGETTGLGFGSGGLYGGRTTMDSYLTMAAYNGFTMGTMNAPIIMLDGQYGVDTFDYYINGEYVEKVAVARGMLGFDKIIILTHAKGHGIAGLGGAIKNIGIGCVGKYSKAVGHSDLDIKVNEEKCIAEECEEPCIKYCPTFAIKINEVKNKAEIDHEKCVYCFHCISVCRKMAKASAISITWTKSHDLQAMKFAENALGVVESIGREKFLYLNLIIDVTENCDCVSFTPRNIVPDIGILASRDPVAIDQASVDLINELPGVPGSKAEGMKPQEDKLKRIYLQNEEEHTAHISMLEHAEKIGLGTRNYELKEVEPRKKQN
ncbi:MAG: DUF362 domain-containing protein, partial [Candidatus Heimdallarchaeaceae archaeon]